MLATEYQRVFPVCWAVGYAVGMDYMVVDMVEDCTVGYTRVNIPADLPLGVTPDYRNHRGKERQTGLMASWDFLIMETCSLMVMPPLLVIPMVHQVLMNMVLNFLQMFVMMIWMRKVLLQDCKTVDSHQLL